MQFNEDLARQIIAKHNLAPNTLKTWQHRQSIPDKYNDPEFSVRKKLSKEQDLQAAKNVFRALQTNKFNMRSLARLAGLKEFVIADFKKGATALAEQELVAIKKAINTIRNEAKAILADCEKSIYPEMKKKLLAQFIKRPELQFTIVMDGHRQAYDALNSWAKGDVKSFPARQYIIVLKSCLLVFITETTI